MSKYKVNIGSLIICKNRLKIDYGYNGNVQSLVTISSTGKVLVDYNYA
ncbi:hypothetical protein [Clostridium gasigenes]|nr:hypothetical protein [Clostridium gasigenes]MBB6624499.1 hypothetical protein [Clostridium gasigenes]